MYYARIIQFLFPIHDTADTQTHSGNNLYLSDLHCGSQKLRLKPYAVILDNISLKVPCHSVCSFVTCCLSLLIA